MLPGGAICRLALLLAVAAAPALLAGAAEARPAHSTSNAVGFYPDLANFVNSPGVGAPTRRPALILLRQDGSIVVEHMRWRSWGRSVARGRGTYSASDCTPDCAQGQRTNSPARVTLSKPGRVAGRRVYRCVKLTVPAQQIDDYECLKRSEGKLIGYAPVSATKPGRTYAFFYSPSGNIICEMGDNGTAQAGVACMTQKPPAMAGLKANGVVTICQHQGLKCTANLGPPRAPRKLAYGHSIRVGGFRCTSARKGVTCRVTATGKGFFISKQAVRRVG